MENTESGLGPIRWYYKPWVVVCMLFLVLGPFGLPLVYRNPKFSRLWKIVLTVVMIPYTWYLVVITVKTYHQTSKIALEIQERLK